MILKYELDKDLKEFREFSREDLTTSDLQGNAMTYGIKYVGTKNIREVNKISDIFLSFAYNSISMTDAKKQILKTIKSIKSN